jgi:hypothetical protein
MKKSNFTNGMSHWRCIRMQQHLPLQAVDCGNALFEDASKSLSIDHGLNVAVQ